MLLLKKPKEPTYIISHITGFKGINIKHENLLLDKNKRIQYFFYQIWSIQLLFILFKKKNNRKGSVLNKLSNWFWITQPVIQTDNFKYSRMKNTGKTWNSPGHILFLMDIVFYVICCL